MEDLVMLALVAVPCVFIGYVVGEMVGYSRGIRSACSIWQRGFVAMADAFFACSGVSKKKGQ